MINKNNQLIYGPVKVGRFIFDRINSIITRIKKSIEFFYDYLKFKKFLKNQKIDKQIEILDHEKICITVIPWLGSAVPWYSVTIALMLYKRGKSICILFDDMPFGDDKLYHRLQSKLIFNILIKLPIKLIKLSDYQSLKLSSREVDRLVKLNSLHATHGENNLVARRSYEKIIKDQLSLIYSKIAALYEEEKFPQIFLPGGIWGSSCIFPLFAKKNNTQITTYDAGESRLVLSVFGVAAQLQDIPYSFNKILKNPKEKKFAIEKGFTQLEKRRTGNDMISYFQDATNTSQFGNDYYLMLLNSVWDSATLGLHTVYKSMNEWMLDSIEWVLKNTEKKIIIRQHPAERVKDLNNTDLYKEQIEKRFGINKRVIFIEAKKDINTYNLIENALCVLGFSSTIIVESVALGKASIIVSRTYYADFGIVYNAKDKREYYMYLTKASISDLLITQEMKDRACISNYITQSCNWYKTEFTPVRNNFLKWSKLNLQDLENDYLPLQAILNNRPLSIIQHEHNFKDVK
tara:strand:- start:27 stop:1580 length:1554 start_codon:yes stop_codon:yes gene_type:complete